MCTRSVHCSSSTSSEGVPGMLHRSQCGTLIRVPDASCEVDSITDNILRGGRVSDSRPAREDARSAAVIAGEEAFVAPNAVVYILIEDACFELPREWKGREEVHESLS